ncbi:MAG: class I SAM-dependent methyltransferase, partial [Nitrospirota bacterium]|nr:class I SAM-dependent methyltransferase [Nitrospirota bacterium]
MSISLFTSTISIKTISYIVAFLLLYFSLLKSTVGPEGKIIGVDITDRMLQQAEERVVRNGWANIDLVKSDAAEFRFPQDVDGII